MIYVAPGANFEATLTGAPTGLTGILGVRILDNGGGTPIPRQTTGIAEFPAGSGFYTVTLTAPTVAGQYTVMWDTGGALTPSNTFTEDLAVTSTTPGGAVPAGIDLTDLASVRSFMQRPGTDVEQDPLIQVLITAASREIRRVFEREFSDPKLGLTRRFEVDTRAPMLSLAPYDLRVLTTLRIDPEASGGGTVLVRDQDFRLRPVEAPDGVYTSVRFNWLPARTGTWRSHTRLVDITGDWGFASVPPEVKHWCNVTVVEWLRKDVSAFSSVFNVDSGSIERPASLPAAVIAGLSHYRRGA